MSDPHRPNPVANLRAILAELYPDEASIRRVIADAGLEAGRIAISLRAVDTWHAIVTEATQHGQGEALLAVVLAEYPTNERLLEACVAFGAHLADAALATADESPYKGLQYFDVADAGLFFGREQLTAQLVKHVRQQRFLAVVGASGSGKSSLVRAGLVPALTKGQPLADGTLPPVGSARWRVHIVTPTARPLLALAASLTQESESVTAQGTLLDDMGKEPRTLDFFAVRLVAKTGAQRLLLVVDQFEGNCLLSAKTTPNNRPMWITCWRRLCLTA